MDKYGALFDLIVGLLLFTEGIYNIKNRKLIAKQYSGFYYTKIVSETVCEKILVFFIAPFYIVMGFIAVVIGLLFLF